MKRSKLRVSAETAKAAFWATGPKPKILCGKCGTRGFCVPINCDDPMCRRPHASCEFCFIGGVLKGKISPNPETSKAGELATKNILENMLFQGEEE
jgi:hypothetical protein